MAYAIGTLWNFVVPRVLEYNFVFFRCKVVFKAASCSDFVDYIF